MNICGPVQVLGGYNDNGEHLKGSELVTVSEKAVEGDGESEEQGMLCANGEDVPEMKFKRSGSCVVGLRGGKSEVCVYAFGGFSGVEPLKFVEVMKVCRSSSDGDEEQGALQWSAWKEVHMMASPRFGAAAVAVSGVPTEETGGQGPGRIAVFGGFDGAEVVADCSVFTPDGDAACSGGHGQWNAMASMPVARMSHAAVAFRGKVYVLGGSTHKGKVLSSVDEWDPDANVWAKQPLVPPLPQPRKDAAAFVLDGELWVVGGEHQGGWLQDSLVWNEAHGAAWHPGPLLPSARSGMAAVVVP